VTKKQKSLFPKNTNNAKNTNNPDKIQKSALRWTEPSEGKREDSIGHPDRAGQSMMSAFGF